MEKRDGFQGQRTFVIPEHIIHQIMNEPLNQTLYITDIGYYPKAINHYRARPEGCPQYILMYCTSGSGWITVDRKKITVKANQYFIIPANKPHSYGSNKQNPWSIYWVHYTGSQAPFFSNNISSAQSITPSSIDRIDDRLQLFEEIMNNLEMGYSLDNVSYTNICLWHFLGSFRFLSQFRQMRKIKDKDMIASSIHYMRENLQSKLTLQQLAKQAGLSTSHYSFEFKKKTRHSPMDYLIQLKIQYACQLLDHTSMRLKEIALRIGYDDPFYFSRIFKKQMGVSPKTYKTKLKG
ncbi:helix-turn-helix domain-containing protein [Geofilum sp. OHC36d9]|uniref:helix-turn-helix domain-containing protein n=1 Tax=Geofilum sp. OHC36d9 TaxID=3458413 RepID=UPI00403393A6